jgi:hypothetical protein
LAISSDDLRLLSSCNPTSSRLLMEPKLAREASSESGIDCGARASRVEVAGRDTGKVEEDSEEGAALLLLLLLPDPDPPAA